MLGDRQVEVIALYMCAGIRIESDRALIFIKISLEQGFSTLKKIFFFNLTAHLNL